MIEVFLCADSYFGSDETIYQDFKYVIVENGKVSTMPADNQQDEKNMWEKYPERNWNDGCLSRWRGKLDRSEMTDSLAIEKPEVWAALNEWTEFQDRSAG